MIVKLNDLTLNDETGGYLVQDKIEGISTPETRLSTGLYAGRDGGYASSFLYGMRNIALQGVIWAESVQELDTRRRALATAVASGDVELRLTTNAGASYVVFCKLQSLDIPIGSNPLLANFQVQLLAPDPVIYDDTGDDDLTADLPLLTGGGLTWSLTWPLEWAAGAGVTSIDNSGSVDTYPVITLTGSATGPVLTNQTTQQVLKLTTLNMGEDDTLVIDMKNRTVLLNDGNVLPYVTEDSDWWALVTGSNKLTLTTSSGDDTVSGTVTWMPGYMGI